MIDSGAISSFIDANFLESHKNIVQPRQKEIPYEVVAVAGRPVESGKIISEVNTELKIGEHSEDITLDVTQLGHYPIILGIPWLKKHDPEISWPTHRMAFNSEKCTKCLNNPHIARLVVHGLIEHPFVPIPANSSVKINLTQVPVMSPQTPVTIPVNDTPATPATLVTHRVNAHAITPASGAPTHVYLTHPVSLVSCTSQDHDSLTVPVPAQNKNKCNQVPSHYQEHLEVFSEKEANTLPLHSSFDHSIPLIEGNPSFRPYLPLV